MRVFKQTCEICGEKFVSYSTGKKYCSKDCAQEAREIRKEGQLCWRCRKACGKCSWSKNLKPIDGWTATPTIIKDSTGDFDSYKITECPEFEEDDREVTRI